MGATWRVLPAWPYPPSLRSSTRFHTAWDASLRKLAEEVARIKGDDLVIGVVADPSAISFSGVLKPGAKVNHRGAEVSFDVPGRGRLAFHTDAFPTLHANLHAIYLGLEALRRVDDYGITSGAEQYAGFAMLGAGTDLVRRGQELVSGAGGLTKALKIHHPDHGGRAEDLQAVLAYKARVGA